MRSKLAQTNEMNMQNSCVGDPTQPIFHLFALRVCIGYNTNFSIHVEGNTNFSVFRYQYVGIANAKNTETSVISVGERGRSVIPN